MNYTGGHMMRPESRANNLLSITRSKAKMYEFNIPEEYHIRIELILTDLLDLAIGILGDLAAEKRLNETTEKSLLNFSANYFDALLNSKASENIAYLKVLGASSYYLADYPGSAAVLINDIRYLELNCNSLDVFLLHLLKMDFTELEIPGDTLYFNEINSLIDAIKTFFESGEGVDDVALRSEELKRKAYRSGNDRELLLSDIIDAVCYKKVKTSSWEILPRFSELPKDIWVDYLGREDSVKELWPSQILIGEKGVYKGKSAIIQMPTSAGKTRSTELIIRSSFLSARSQFAVIVAPFRALCHEIFNDMHHRFKDEENVDVTLISDVFQMDFENVQIDQVQEGNSKKTIFIVTPEKLEYILRQDSTIGEKIGLIIYDEGHLFDDKSRGVKYELLLASLKQLLPVTAQVVLISAVVRNSEEIGGWLLQDDFEKIEATNLTPTQRNVAFVSWIDQRAQLKFVSKDNTDEDEFFVPRVAYSQLLNRKPRERKDRRYPEKDEGGYYNPSHVAVALGCNLVNSGSVAIFTGRKDSATLIAKDIVDAFERGVALPQPNVYGVETEITKLSNYVGQLLGNESISYKACIRGILLHHGSTPNVLRMASEYALQEQHFKFVICTSTLSQGVNLPIRYLVVTGNRQGEDKIKTRDFHNLMGRAGRAGKYTEGTVIFSDQRIYDLKNNWYENWRWRETKALLNPNNSESCRSHILTLLESEPEDPVAKEIWEKNRDSVTSDINSYLLNALANIEMEGEVEELASRLVQNTLAYKQANHEEKSYLVDVFKGIAKVIVKKEPNASNRKYYARAIVDIDKCKEIQDYLQENIDEINNGIKLIYKLN